MIKVDRLARRFGALTAVDGVSFSVERGEVVGFLGPNGAGKSTTMRMITGFLEPTAGTAIVAGIDVRRARRMVQQVIGYLPEGAPAYGDMTTAAFLRFVGRLRGLSDARLESRMAEMAARLHLDGVWHQRIDTLSKGFRRRVGIAQALLHDPPVLILDEPTDGLDPNQKQEMRELIRAVRVDKAIIVSTHILEEVEAVCSRAVIIAEGRVVADATPVELLAHDTVRRVIIVNIDAAHGERATRLLSSLPEVARVDFKGAVGNVASLHVSPSADGQCMTAVSAALESNGVIVSELRLDRPRLDEVFRQLTCR